MYNEEKLLKRFLKKKIKFSLGFLVSFLITGSMGFATDFIVNTEDFEFGPEDTSYSFINVEKGDYFLNNGKISFIDKIGGILWGYSSNIINGENGELYIKTPSEELPNSNMAQGIYGDNCNITNNGKIIIEGVETSNNRKTFGTAIAAHGKSFVTNNGKIIVTGLSANGVFSNGATVINEANGEITVKSNDGASGISLSNQNDINGNQLPDTEAYAVNKGSIIVEGENSIGINNQRKSTFINEGTILTTGNSSFGIYTQMNGVSSNDGIIKTTGDYGTGVKIENSQFLNKTNGNITTNGNFAVGIYLNNYSKGKNSGNIKTTGLSSMGVLVNHNSQFENTGLIEVNGDAFNNHNVNSGIDIQNTSKALNNGNIKTTGKAAFGIRNNGIAINDEDGVIETEGLNGNGICSQKNSLTDEGIAINLGKVITKGEGAKGITVNGNDAKGLNNGSILTTGNNSNGMDAWQGIIENNGSISTLGNFANGMKIDNSIAINGKSGIITTEGNTSRGIAGFNSGKIENYGRIETTGIKARGIHLNGKEIIGINHKSGLIKTLGEKSYGMRAFNGASLENHGTILTGDKKDSSKGFKAYGMNAFRSIFLGKVESDSDVLETVVYDYKDDYASNDCKVLNTGTIETYGDFTHGINIFSGNNVINSGDISTDGVEASGIAINYSGTGENSGKIQTTGDEAKGIKVISMTYSSDEIEYELNGEEKYKYLISKNDDKATFINHKNGNIITKGDSAYGVYLDSHIANDETIDLANKLGIILEETEIKKAEFTNNGNIETHGDSAYGIFSSASIVNNNGKIHTRGKGAYGIYAINGSEVNHTGKIHVNDPQAFGIVYDSTSIVNISKNAEIKVNGKGSNAIKMLENIQRDYSMKSSKINNYGDISIEGENSKGIVLQSQGEAMNSGTIDIIGENAIGMLANGYNSLIINSGLISLNLQDKSIAMKGENGATVTNSGTIKLKDFTDINITQKDLNNILNVDKNSSLINNGLVVNSQDKIVISSGEIVENEIISIEKDEIFKSNDTITITGNKLEGILNQGENFVENNNKYLLKVENSDSELLISGTINAGKNAIEVGKNSSINFTGTVNSLENAFNLNSSNLKSINGNIVGNIVLSGDNSISLSNSEIAGDIIGNDNSINDIKIEDSTSIKGNILLGSGNDNLSIDSSSANLLLSSAIIDGGNGNDSITIGEKDSLTIVKATLKNFDNNYFLGTVYLDHNAKILSESSTTLYSLKNSNIGDINIPSGSTLILGVNENGEHSLDSISGNTISAQDGGTLIIQSDNIKINNSGKYELNLSGTNIDLLDDNISTSQFIYNISKVNEDILELSMKSLDNIGISNDYKNIYDSLISSGFISDLNSTKLGNEKELESILYQTKYKTPYSYSIKSSKNFIDAWNNGITSLNNIIIKEKWNVTGKVIGSYDNFKGDYSHDSNQSGLLASGEYGISQNASFGLNFGGGKSNIKLDDNSSKLESDNFYFGLFSRKTIGNLNFLGALGYQKDRYEAKRSVTNNVDYFTFDKNYDLDGLNFLLESKYIYLINDEFFLEPKLSFNYNYLSQKSLSENNKTMALSVSKETANIFEGSFEIDFKKNIYSYKGFSGSLFTGIGYSYIGGDINKNLDAYFENGSKFEIQGPDFGGNKGKLSIGGELSNQLGYSYGVKLDYNFGKNTRDTQVVVSLGYQF